MKKVQQKSITKPTGDGKILAVDLRYTNYFSIDR
jgi:cell division septal protein FtsQ